jgi:hypothetical protein
MEREHDKQTGEVTETVPAPSLFETIIAANPYSATNREEAKSQAEIIAASGLYGIESKEEAYVILMTGKDLGLSESQALRGIRVWRGVPCLSADLFHAIVLRSPQCEYLREVSTDATQSTWETKRKGEPPTRETFTMEDAKRAGLLGKKTPWETYPGRMMKARAKAFLSRDVYPDVTFGLYTQDEMSGGEVEPSVQPVPVERVEDLPTELSEPIDPDPWQDRMRRALEAGDRRLATQIGMDAWNAADKDMDVKAEALAILGEGGE